MSADIANWLQVNIVNNPQVLKSLIALIILIVAIFLFSEKPTEKNLFRSRRVWGALLFVFAIFVFLFANIADLADAFIVWATIVLAGVAVFSFEESRRLRKQYKEREELDRKERLLNEIIEWASDGIRLCALHKVRTKRAMVEVKYTRIADLVALHSKRESISVLARRVDKRLIKPVNKAISALTEYLGGVKGIGILHLLEEHEGEEILNIYPEVWRDFEKSFRRLLKTISKIKSEL